MTAWIIVLAVLAWLFWGGDDKKAAPSAEPKPPDPPWTSLADYGKSEAMIMPPPAPKPSLLGPPPRRLITSVSQLSALEGSGSGSAFVPSGSAQVLVSGSGQLPSGRGAG